MKSIAAFLNTDGGTLLIGVDDYGLLLGIQPDYATLNKNNADGFLLRLNEILISTFTKRIFTNVKCSIQSVERHEVCMIMVEPSTTPVFITSGGKKQFFIRANASVQSLDIEDTATYISAKWSKT